MNWRMIRRNSWDLVHIEPTPKRFFGGIAGTQIESLEDLWLVYPPTKSGVTILNTRTHHVARLTKSQIRGYDDYQQRCKDYAALILREQLNIGGNDLWFTPVEHDIARRRYFMQKLVTYAATKGYTIDRLIQMIESGISSRQFVAQVFSV